MLTEKIQLGTDERVTLTAYIPDVSDEMENKKVKPAVIVIPGGSYKFCSDREAEPVAFEFMAKGFNAFVLRYSLNENAAFPKPLEDAQKALALIKSNAQRWHTDSEKIAVCGFSAGGHLAAAMSTMSEDKPAACILGYPCILESVSPILAKPVESLDKYVTPETPPTFIAAASDDTLVPVENSLRFADALDKNGVSFELHIFSKGGHGFSAATDVVADNEESLQCFTAAKPWIELCISWLNRLFK